MSKINIRGIEVSFPYEKPYDIQVAYMDKVVQCLEEKRHGVLESPTGTGKTLCLFAPVTSWLRHKKLQKANDYIRASKNEGANSFDLVLRKPRVWYTARTHSQIAQTVAEVRRCNIDGLSIRVMGARDQLCINPAVASEKDSYIKTVKCKELVKNRSCSYHRRLDYDRHAPMLYEAGKVMDIEDLAEAGRSCGVCPYFMAKLAKDTADVVLMPYNYIIDRESRDTSGRSYENDVVIFDEGHNVPTTCESSFEFSLTSVDLALGMRNIQELMENLAKMKDFEEASDDSIDIAKHADNCLYIASVLKGLEAGLAEVKESNDLYHVKDLYALLEKAGVNRDASINILQIIESFVQDSIRLQLNGFMLSTFDKLTKVLQTLFGPAIGDSDPETINKSFKFVVAPDPDHVKNSKKLSLFCFNPSFGIKDVLFMGVNSMIITSGTLSPIPTFIQELSLPNPVTLENGHIAGKEQVPFMILGTGVNNVKMDASFKNRKDPAYMYSLGMTLANLISSIPDGVLLLFSSYSMMNSLKEHWENETAIWKRLNDLKRVFVEPRGKEEFLNCMENYRRAIDAGNGAILMGVLRGKISEGMDFKDQYCRGVFIVGVPFPTFMDPKVKGKEKYCDTLFVKNPDTNRNEKLYEISYMSVEAMKATNQAIGRVIRHAGDYGAIILVDYRFCWPRLFTNISKWLRGEKPQEVNFMGAKKCLREFFKNLHSGDLGVNEIRCQPIKSNGDPITGDVKYDVYDHKTARNITPAPWIASTSEGSYKRRQYDDWTEAKSSTDFFSKYSQESDNASPVNKRKARQKKDPVKEEPKSQSTSFLDALESADDEVHAYTGYREVDKASLTEDLQKRKNEEMSPTLLSSSLSSQKKKQCRRIIVPSLSAHEPEPESKPLPKGVQINPEKQAIKSDLINYFVKTRSMLAEKDAQDFKETAWKYMKGEIPLTVAFEKIKTILGSKEHKQALLGFSVCVRSKDRPQWDEITQELNQ